MSDDEVDVTDPKVREKYYADLAAKQDEEYERRKSARYHLSTEEQNLILQIISERERQGLTQKELASRAGVAVRTLSRIENAKASPTLRHLMTILHVLGFGVAVLKKPN